MVETIEKRRCDLCQEPITGSDYVEMTITEKAVPNSPPKVSDVCRNCFNRLRVYIRRGLPKISELDTTVPSVCGMTHEMGVYCTECKTTPGTFSMPSVR